jgi:hypothetical protein
VSQDEHNPKSTEVQLCWLCDDRPAICPSCRPELWDDDDDVTRFFESWLCRLTGALKRRPEEDRS